MNSAQMVAQSRKWCVGSKINAVIQFIVVHAHEL